MDVNTITLDGSAGPKPSNAPPAGDGSFQVAYARVLGENYTPVAREGTPMRPPRGQDSPPPADRIAHTVRAGDTLYGIVRARLATMGAEANARTTMQGVKQLAQANNIRNPDRIYVGQKVDLAALDSSFGGSQTVSRADSYRSANAATGIKHPRQWEWDEPAPENNAQFAAEEEAALPMPLPALPAAMPAIAPDSASTEVDASVATPQAARQLALYKQNAMIATEQAVEPAHALPDIVYKGVVGKVLDAVPLEPATRTGLQQASTVVGSTFTARSLGALTGLGGPLLTVAGLIWGIFSSRQIDSAAALEAKATGAIKPLGVPKPAPDTMQTAQNKPSEALN